MIEQIEFLKSHFEKDDLMGHELAVLILQKQERARQGQIRALCMKKIQFNERRRLQRLKQGIPKYTKLQACIKIQATVRGFLQRRRTEKQRSDEFSFLDMQYLPTTKSNIAEKAFINSRKRIILQKENETLLLNALNENEKRVMEQQGPVILEKIENKIRDWIVTKKNNNWDFPRFSRHG